MRMLDYDDIMRLDVIQVFYDVLNKDKHCMRLLFGDQKRRSKKTLEKLITEEQIQKFFDAVSIIQGMAVYKLRNRHCYDRSIGKDWADFEAEGWLEIDGAPKTQECIQLLNSLHAIRRVAQDYWGVKSYEYGVDEDYDDYDPLRTSRFTLFYEDLSDWEIHNGRL